MGKTELRLEIDEALVARAEAAGLEVGPFLEQALRTVLPAAGEPVTGILANALRQSLDPAGAEERGRKWAEENAEAIEAYRRRIERRGVFGEDLRRW